jgi:hypothetical protein
MARNRSYRWVFAAVVAAGPGCGGKVFKGVGGKEGMMSGTAAARQCEEAAKEHDRPFVVEWDATDLASFEAKAARDAVVVRYEGCDLEILHECSDAVVPGKLGSYGTPQFTSGTSQSFQIRNEAELYAKLPLGVAQFGGRVSAGEGLDLEYFVTGVALASRPQLYRDELQAYPGCEGATHFVWSYNLGAFELSTFELTEAQVEAGAGNVGGGVHGKKSRAAVGSGGDLESCQTQDQRGCRVPIRLVLREIQGGQAPANVAGSPTGNEAAAAAAGAPPSDRAQELWKHARTQFDKGDGSACVAEMDQALSADMQLMDQHQFKIDYALCQMAAGDCDKGSKGYREALAAADIKRQMPDWKLDMETRRKANRTCPSGTANNPPDFVVRAYYEIQQAKEVKDGPRCERLIKDLTKNRAKVSANKPAMDAPSHEQVAHQDASTLGSNAYDPAAECITRSSHKCRDFQRILALQCDVMPANIREGCRKAVESNAATSIKTLKIDCK